MRVFVSESLFDYVFNHDKKLTNAIFKSKAIFSWEIREDLSLP